LRRLNRRRAAVRGDSKALPHPGRRLFTSRFRARFR